MILEQVFLFGIVTVLTQSSRELYECPGGPPRHALPEIRHLILVGHHPSYVQMCPVRGCHKLLQECSSCACSSSSVGNRKVCCFQSNSNSTHIEQTGWKKGPHGKHWFILPAVLSNVTHICKRTVCDLFCVMLKKRHPPNSVPCQNTGLKK